MPLFRRTDAGIFVAQSAVVTGDVAAGAGASFWFGAVVRGDVARVTVGAGTNVQDNAVVHCDSGEPNVIGENVTIGHAAIVHGVSVGDGSLVGMGAKLLGGSVVGRGALVAAGALVPPRMEVPDGTLAVGVPAKVVRPVNEEEKKYLAWLAEHYVGLAARYADGEIESAL